MGNIIVGTIILMILGLVVTKLIRDKKKGNHCPGCPHSNGGCVK